MTFSNVARREKYGHPLACSDYQSISLQINLLF
jgi:hypothetical protein